MKSETLQTANRKPVWIRRLKFSAVTVILLFLLIRLLTSSYAFCNWYLPIASGSLGVRISADEVKFTPFSGKRHLNFRGLQVEIPDRMIFTAQRFKAKISFQDLLFRHIYTLNKVQVERASLVLEDLRESKDQKTVSGLERIRIGHVAVDNFYIRYAPRNSAAYFNAFIDEFSADSMMPDRWNTIHFQTFLSWDLPDSTMLELP
ncbi:MAG: hypothetical protein J6Q65_05140, partial [Lentisphaeria bacterium]|nr:hypothetical protein [Lentisphaeria bacterium]